VHKHKLLYVKNDNISLKTRRYYTTQWQLRHKQITL